jgi:uncharacterized protein (TIGR00251 family)
MNVKSTPRGVTLDVEVKVRASKSRVLGVKGERLSVALAAPPVDGAANEALRRTLAEFFEIPRAQVSIIAGEKSRRKAVELGGLSPAEVSKRLAGLESG